MHLTNLRPLVRAVLTYFSICGRGEVARLVAAAGEVEFTDNALGAGAPGPQGVFDETGGWNQALQYKEMGEGMGFPGVLPLLEHDGMKIYQTTAIERYLAAISPKYAGLTPKQKALDEMFLLIKSDINGTTESLLFKKIDGETLTAAMDKFYPLVEGLLPEGGAYINGLDFPTPGDIAVMVTAMGCMPFRAAPQVAGCAPTADKYPKMMALAAKVAAYAPIATFLAASEHKTLKADPFGIMPGDYKA